MVGLMADCWVESMVVTSAGLRADWMTVELVGLMAKDWIDEIVG